MAEREIFTSAGNDDAALREKILEVNEKNTARVWILIDVFEARGFVS